MSAEEVLAKYRGMTLLEIAQMEKAMLAIAQIGRAFAKMATSEVERKEMLRHSDEAEDTLRLIRKVLKEKEGKKVRGRAKRRRNLTTVSK